MGLFRPSERRSAWAGSPTYNPFENPAVPLSSVALDSAFGLLTKSESGEPVTVDNTVGVPTVWRCINLLSTVVASCPLRTYSTDQQERERELIRIPVLSPYNSWIDTKGNTVYPLYTPFELWELVVAHICLYGNAYILKVRNGADSIVDLRPIHPDRVMPRIDKETKEKIFEVKKVVNGQIMALDPDVYTTFEIMHVPGFGFDGFVGLSPIQVAMTTFGTAKAGDRLAAKFYANGSQLSGIIQVKAPLANQEQAEGIRSRWMAKHGGVGHGAGVAVMDAETDWIPLTIPPDQLQFIDSRRWETNEIARMFGVPPHLVGDVERSTSWGTGIEEQNVGFANYTIGSYTGRCEQRVTREVVNTRYKYAEFDYSRLLRGDMQKRFSAYATAVKWGWMTRNEVRGSENQKPIEGLDEPLNPNSNPMSPEADTKGNYEDNAQP